MIDAALDKSGMVAHARRSRRGTLSGPLLLPEDGRPPREIILFLHGLASNGDFLHALGPRLQACFPRALIAAPNAPMGFPGVDHAYQWWRFDGLGPRSLAAGVKDAAPALQRYIDALLAASGLSEERLVLAGFSQGAMLAVHAAITRPRTVAGVVAYSGMLAHRALPWRAFGRKPPILLVHGGADAIIQPAAHEDAAARLSGYGCAVQPHLRRELGHAVDRVGFATGVRFIRQVLHG